jgi:uncharacterized protein YqjF (DUF2071 family)
MSWLDGWFPKHPVPMRTVFRSCFLVNFAIDADVMHRLLPPQVEPDLHRGEAYLSIVIACVKRMRPAFVPRVLGINFNQVVYRVVARCRGQRGVYFLRSDADSRLMCWGGNLLTFFRFHHARIAARQEAGRFHFDLLSSPGDGADIHVTYDLAGANQRLAGSSRFTTLEEAQGFLVELYTAFGVYGMPPQVQAVHIERGDWDIRVVNAGRVTSSCSPVGCFPRPRRGWIRFFIWRTCPITGIASTTGPHKADGQHDRAPDVISCWLCVCIWEFSQMRSALRSLIFSASHCRRCQSTCRQTRDLA